MGDVRCQCSSSQDLPRLLRCSLFLRQLRILGFGGKERKLKGECHIQEREKAAATRSVAPPCATAYAEHSDYVRNVMVCFDTALTH